MFFPTKIIFLLPTYSIVFVKGTLQQNKTQTVRIKIITYKNNKSL